MAGLGNSKKKKKKGMDDEDMPAKPPRRKKKLVKLETAPVGQGGMYAGFQRPGGFGGMGGGPVRSGY